MLFAATCVLSLVATLACSLPSWRAAGVDPMKTTRVSQSLQSTGPRLLWAVWRMEW